MCLILLAFQTHPDAAVLLAGNRDEAVARPTAPPAVLQHHPRIEAGRDLEAGGTWMGRNEHGLLAALTNRHVPGGNARPHLRSRGEIVLRLLQCTSAGEAREVLAALEPDAYRPFNVLVGDAAAFYYRSSHEPGGVRALAPGFHALSNASLDDTSWPKVARSHRFWQRHAGLEGEALLRAVQAFLCDPTPPDDLPAGEREEEVHGPLGAVFIDTPGYGTVSSSILTAGGRLGWRYYHAPAAAMRAAQQGWARTAWGNGGVPETDEGSPYTLLTFGE